ncbi:unnamed protein product [Effrenium voratum]|uniref:Choline transporter-like protein n=1 Tax=Effrenium voratum TaxID=2562239 RepID=A0AA36MQ09_9DINO|nr:unnamed protein product [Effrenium voratum]
MYGHAGREIIPLCNKQVDVDNLKEIRDAPEKRRQNKIQEIRAGASLLQRNGRFPSNRPCQDCAWAVLFGVVVMAVVGFCVYYSQEIDTTINDDSDFINGRTHDHLSVEDINHLALTVNLAGIAGTVASLFVAFFYMTAAHSCPRPIVYTSLYLVPALSILGGAVMLYFGFSRLNDPHLSEEKQGASYSFLFSGLALMAMGMCYGFCVFCCWSRYIPFTIQVLEMVADVSSQNPCMIVVSVLGACASSVWIVMVSVCYAMTMLKHEKDYANQNKHLMTPLDFVFVLTLGWGCGVIAMVCHTAYCGVFTRWYFAQPGNYLWKSLRVALTTSFGSICFGSFTIAAIRAVEALVRSAQRQASSDGAGLEGPRGPETQHGGLCAPVHPRHVDRMHRRSFGVLQRLGLRAVRPARHLLLRVRENHLQPHRLQQRPEHHRGSADQLRGEPRRALVRPGGRVRGRRDGLRALPRPRPPVHHRRGGAGGPDRRLRRRRHRPPNLQQRQQGNPRVLGGGSGPPAREPRVRGHPYGAQCKDSRR